MSFIHPYWLFALLILPLLVVLKALKSRNTLSVSLLAPRLQKRIESTKKTKGTALAFSMRILALALAIFALARPYDGEQRIEIDSSGHNLFILIDVSHSMLSEDSQPSRIYSAQTKAIEIVNKLPSSKIGLAKFAESLTLITPYTEDHQTITKFIRECNPDETRASGSDLGRALSSSISTLTHQNKEAHSILILSDGEMHSNAVDSAANLASDKNIKLFTVGVGTKAGGTIPDLTQRDGKFKDPFQSRRSTSTDISSAKRPSVVIGKPSPGRMLQ